MVATIGVPKVPVSSDTIMLPVSAAFTVIFTFEHAPEQEVAVPVMICLYAIRLNGDYRDGDGNTC